MSPYLAIAWVHAAGAGAFCAWGVGYVRLLPAGLWIGLPIPRWRVAIAIAVLALVWPIAIPLLWAEARR